jgi:Xaa-Pro aminopeptidase
MLGWETLTLAPVDRRLIVREMLEPGRAGLARRLSRAGAGGSGGVVAPETARWLRAACAPL